MTDPRTFGGELRRRRVAAGFSLNQLAVVLHYSKGYLSKIETGERQASPKLARQADVALEADGTLAALVPFPETAPEPEEPEETSALLNRRALLAFGSALLLPLELRASDAEAAAEDEDTERIFREQFDRCRQRGQLAPPGLVLRQLVMELQTLQELVDACRQPRARERLSALAARFAEYAGWMLQEAGRPDSALAWTRYSAEIAGDTELAAFALVREAELAMYAHDPMTCLELTQRARLHPRANPRIRGLAAHWQAQGHALLGDYRSCRTALDDGAVLLAQHTTTNGPVLGSSVPDLGEAIAGWCYYELGRPRQAADALELVVSRTPESSRRARALHGARLALAYEATGELDRMCEVGFEVLAKAQPLGSATVRGQLRELARNVLRRHSYRPALELHAEITAALHVR